ncbi:HPr family phosphocarrier protein [Paenibacillus zeisoli]|uniref:HPr family phosphocarrier protein n=1 Tax=Paenibacillus zeisoli TaxID=2496267 RepID=A0A3S1B9Z5_9BACL|nr:HPr family phosphocarrier protein [Paenibacillus zeisoli]RUT36518.1 HPr family phosphocarrier protein [Paenibacillus zeisoli]
MRNTTEIGWEISKTANKFKSSCVLKFGKIIIDAKSILGVFVTLTEHHNYELYVMGPDEDEAKRALSDLFVRYDLSYIIK